MLADVLCGSRALQPAQALKAVLLYRLAELPESLKALFRPVSMVVPDLGIICEIMLMAEGFQMSKILSRKFVILYKLCEDLLSKSKHYDWKLRAIKTTLYVAGGMKRAAPELTEDKVRWQPVDAEIGNL
jgi:dynein heavy chain